MIYFCFVEQQWQHQALKMKLLIEQLLQSLGMYDSEICQNGFIKS